MLQIFRKISPMKIVQKARKWEDSVARLAPFQKIQQKQ